jgi:hypothetical protein
MRADWLRVAVALVIFEVLRKAIAVEETWTGVRHSCGGVCSSRDPAAEVAGDCGLFEIKTLLCLCSAISCKCAGLFKVEFVIPGSYTTQC